MVHKKFSAPRSNKKEVVWYDRAPPAKARNYLEEMAPVNGLPNISDEEVRRVREEFNQEVSKRMGELLLRGVAMLDAYCEICSGILMEERSGNRRCVTCEIHNERNPIVAQTPKEAPIRDSDMDEAARDTPEPKVKKETPKTTEVSRDWSSYVDYDEIEELLKQKQSNASTKKEESTSNLVSGVKKSSKKKDGPRLAMDSLNRKLIWASEKLDSENDTRHILDLIEIMRQIAVSMESLKKLNC